LVSGLIIAKSQHTNAKKVDVAKKNFWSFNSLSVNVDRLMLTAKYIDRAILITPIG
jgi:hypothetical protein